MYAIETLYEADGRRVWGSKTYFTKSQAESHYNKMRGKVIAMRLLNPQGKIIRSWREEK